ncbi:MAG: hypothetical protein GY854_31605 [Deltaproteobacteria bacterium]|nr:hypothetical protein [Deltaproteobacteria bacterium]
MFRLELVLGVGFFVMSQVAFSQESIDQGAAEDAEAEVKNDKAASNPAGTESGTEAPPIDELLKRMEGYEAREKAREEEIEELKEELEMQAELSQFEGAGEGSEELDTEQRIWIYGFFDLSFAKTFYKEDAAYGMYTINDSSFMMTGLNVYIRGQLTQSLSALSELRFSFRPVGNEEELQIEGLGDSEYTVTDTGVWDPFTIENYEQHGVSIERVHLTYEPLQWLNIIAGRYLTPYGVWNIDHGSPVVIPVRWPWMQVREMLPKAQTGLQVYGTFIPKPCWFINYAITLSNGRGPMESVMDLDENKAVGLRLALAYRKPKVEVEISGYGYYGKRTDEKKVLQVFGVTPNDELTLEEPVRVKMVETAVQDEYVVSSSFMLKLFGVRLQSELIWNYIEQIIPRRMADDDVILNGGNPLIPMFAPSHTGLGYYVLLAYQLPLDKYLGSFRIMPYLMWEDSDPAEYIPQSGSRIFSAGLNLKPTPNTVIKAEYGRLSSLSDAIGLGEPVHVVQAQLAVSF